MSAECLVSCLEALEDVDSAATAVASERGNLTNANFLRFVGVRASALGDALGTGAALLQNVAAAELAVQGALGVSSVALDRHTVRGSNERSGGSSKNQERLEHDDKNADTQPLASHFYLTLHDLSHEA